MLSKMVLLILHLLFIAQLLLTEVASQKNATKLADKKDLDKWAAQVKGISSNRRATYFFEDPDKTVILNDYEATKLNSLNNSAKRTLRIKLGRIAFYLRVAREFLIDPRTRRNINTYSKFPMPFLKKLHPVLEANCSKSFLQCVISSEEMVRGTYWFSRFFFDLNTKKDSAIDVTEIKKRFVEKNVSQSAFRFFRQPFNDLDHQFEYTLTLNYYFCWYTMLRLPILAYLPYCSYNDQWNSYFAWENTLFRDTDFIDFLHPVPFRCAKFSFCPDPCCFRTSMIQDCDEDQANPCRTLLHKTCLTKPEENDNFVRLIQNDFNKSCKCNARGFRYEPSINECFDDDECESKDTICTANNTICMNTVGSYLCSCIQGYSMEDETKTCVYSESTELMREIRSCICNLTVSPLIFVLSYLMSTFSCNFVFK